MINNDVLVAIEWLKDGIVTGKIGYEEAGSLFEAMNLEFSFLHLGPQFYRVSGGMIETANGKIDFDPNKIESIRVAVLSEQEKKEAFRKTKAPTKRNLNSDSKALEASPKDETVTGVLVDTKTLGTANGQKVKVMETPPETWKAESIKDFKAVKVEGSATGSFKTKPTTKFGGA